MPCESTIRRALQRLDGDELDTAIGAWAAATAPATARRLIAVDGKRVRGSGSQTVQPPAEPRHLLGALGHVRGLVLAQREVGCKTNEITEFAPLLDAVTSPAPWSLRIARAARARRLPGDRAALRWVR